MARLRVAPAAQLSSPKTHNTRQILKEKTNTARSRVPIYETDGNTERFVKDVKSRRGTSGKGAQNEDDLVMTGALGLVEENAPAPAPVGPPMTTYELAKSDGRPPPAAKANRRPPRMTRKVVTDAARSKALEGLKKRMEDTARKEAEKNAKTVSAQARATKLSAAQKSVEPANARSELSISPSQPPDAERSSVKHKRTSVTQFPSSALRPQGTPVENSILALKNFKRRPRQPSMLTMVQQRTASVGPSAVNVQQSGDSSVYDLESGGEDEEDFAPDAEGTPLHLRLAKRRSSASAKKSQAVPLVQPNEAGEASHAPKRTSDALEISSTAATALQAKRRKCNADVEADDTIRVFQKNMSIQRTSSDRRASPLARGASDVLVIGSSSPSSTPPTEPLSSSRRGSRLGVESVVPSTEKQDDDVQYFPMNDLGNDMEQEAPSGTMADPASSSPLPDRSEERQRTSGVSRASTQVTETSPGRLRKKPKKKVKQMSTATLQALLPKRRQALKQRQRRTEYDIPSASEDEIDGSDTSRLEGDEDGPVGRLCRQPKIAASKVQATTVPKPNPRQSNASQRARKMSATTTRKSSAPTTSKKSTKTYGRGTTSDKENHLYESADEDGNDTTDLPEVSMYEAAQSKELEEAKQKFAEVDDWDMTFESMSVDEHRSSSQQWR